VRLSSLTRIAKTPHSLSEISDASRTTNVVNNAAHAASGAPFSQGTVVEIGIVVVVVPVTPTESSLRDKKELLHADKTANARTNTNRDFRVKFFKKYSSSAESSQGKYARRT
jgi:polyferredoxin